ncbi:MAG: hydrogenase expression/formation protein HypE, partial [Clostridia bacterium]|nr:hydrogenase expression/formation protein HypE [Clostridia bacterium]
EDSAVVAGDTKIAITTDSFVVTPLIFKGGDIGSLAVCGTVNDLLMRGAVPKYITSAYIIEEGADTELLTKIAASMAETAKEAGVTVVAGDTKVIEGSGGIYINTTGVGFVNENTDIKSANCKNGDVIILSGTLGDHHAAILSERMNVKNNIKSDCAPLGEMVQNMINAGIEIHAMRDVTRGGLGTVLNEFANVSKCGFEIAEEKIPVTPEVEGFCKILGLNPLHMGNEGKMIAVVAENDAEKAVQIIRKSKYGENAAIIGTVTDGEGVTMLTRLGGKRTVTELYGEGLPRIC